MYRFELSPTSLTILYESKFNVCIIYFFYISSSRNINSVIFFVVIKYMYLYSLNYYTCL